MLLWIHYLCTGFENGAGFLSSVRSKRVGHGRLQPLAAALDRSSENSPATDDLPLFWPGVARRPLHSCALRHWCEFVLVLLCLGFSEFSCVVILLSASWVWSSWTFGATGWRCLGWRGLLKQWTAPPSGTATSWPMGNDCTFSCTCFTSRQMPTAHMQFLQAPG